MKEHTQHRNHKARLFVVSFFFIVILCALIWRMVDLTVIHRQFLQGQGNARSLRVIDIPAYRGRVTDRHGVSLAVSTPVESLWVNPKAFHPTDKELQALAALIKIPQNEIRARLDKAEKREFLYLKRHLTPEEARQIEELHLGGLNFIQEFKRYYPDSDSVSQLIGFTNVDDQGIEGLELGYNYWLAGQSGKRRVVKDRMGRIVEDLGIVKPPRPGHDLELSIDRRIQWFAYHALQRTIDKFAAKSGSVVVLDTKTGEVLAVANYPSFNPHLRGRYTKEFYRNKAITDSFEPGSVIKPFSIASALDTGQFTPQTVIDTRPNWMVVHGHVIRDVHNYGVIDVTGVLQHSSNIGVTKMVLASPPEVLTGVYQRSGFGQRTESGYPGESEGSVVRVKHANPFVQATLAFGYGISVTTLQLAKAYSIFANEGRLVPISLVHKEDRPRGAVVISEKTAREVLLMMETVLGSQGTGKLARVPGYRVAGKTGTARIAQGKKGYDAKRHIATFVGIAPVSDPRLAVAVVINEPSQGGYYGGAVAAPLFSEVMSMALRILDVPPDETAGVNS